MTATHLTTPTRFIEVDGDRFAYRRWGKPSGVPLFFVPHFRGGLDHWDPLLTDGLAEGREVILFESAGIGRSSGEVPTTVAGMGEHLHVFADALGLTQVDLLGFFGRHGRPADRARPPLPRPQDAAGRHRPGGR